MVVRYFVSDVRVSAVVCVCVCVCVLAVCIGARKCCKPEPEVECRAACRRAFVGDSWRSLDGAVGHVTAHCPHHVTQCVANQTSSRGRHQLAARKSRRATTASRSNCAAESAKVCS